MTMKLRFLFKRTSVFIRGIKRFGLVCSPQRGAGTIRTFLPVFFLFCSPCFGQAWSGIIAPARATDWTQAGLPGDVPPDSSWTQCGSTINGYGSSESPGSPSTINMQISGCPSRTYVLLSGTFYLSGSIVAKSNVEIQLANNTIIHSVGANSSFGSSCNGLPATVCIVGSNTYGQSCTIGTYIPCPSASLSTGGFSHEANWTAGFSQGATSITLDRVTGLTPNVTPIVLDQCDTGLTGN